MGNANDRQTVQGVRIALLVGIALDLGLIAAHLLLYPALLAQPGAMQYVAEPVIALLVYAVIVYAVTAVSANAASARRATLGLGMVFGLITGALWLLNLTLETFANLSGLGLLATAPFLIGAFVLWGVAGLVRASQTGAFGPGLLAAVWSAMICVLLTITYGLFLPFVALSTLRDNLARDLDFVHSGWSDLHAFVLANTFASAFSHLLGALIVALLFGSVGSLLGLVFARLRGPKPQAAITTGG
jgi:hypothetical protein